MGAYFNLNEHNLHEVAVEGSRLLFHIPTSSLFNMDELTADIIDTLRQGSKSAEELMAGLRADFPAADIQETMAELIALELVSDGRPLSAESPVNKVESFPLSTVVLNVNTGCNLSCTYCYKEDLDVPSAGRRMELQTAIDSIEMLLRESPDEKTYNVVFFGGEPLSNRRLIEDVVDYCDQRFARHRQTRGLRDDHQRHAADR